MKNSFSFLAFLFVGIILFSACNKEKIEKKEVVKPPETIMGDPPIPAKKHWPPM